MKLKSVGVVLLMSMLGACSEGEIQNGVAHMDPRLNDGRSSAEVLEARREVVRSWDFENGVNPEWQGVPLARGEDFLRAWDWVAGEASAAIDTAFVSGMTWRCETPRATRARLQWRRSTDPEDAWPKECTAELSVGQDEAGAQWVRIDLGGHRGWSGDVVALRLLPDSEQALATLLTKVELEQRGFAAGTEPLGAGEGASRSDGGLVCLDDAGRRTWPASFGVPLLMDAVIPSGGNLVFDLSLSAAHRDSLERIHLAVDVADRGTGGLGGEGWQRLWYRSIVPRMDPRETMWKGFNLDLSEFAGSSVRLRLRAWSGHGQDTVAAGLDGEASLADVYWGSPEVLGAEADQTLPNLLLITLDTMRADYGGGQTPYFDDLRSRGLSFTDNLSASNSTQPSHASILTGNFPIDHGVHDNFALLVGANRTLPERLRELGYHTVGAVSQRYIGAGFGYGQGFDEFIQAAPDAAENGGVTIESLRARVAEWKRLAPGRPVFIWLHVFDAHTPYTAPDDVAAAHAERYGEGPSRQVDPTSDDAMVLPAELPFELQFLRGSNSKAFARHQYAVEVSYTNGLVENFASSLAEAGMLGRTAFFVTADHGESLGEHGIYFGHEGIYGESMEVPLFIQVPGGPEGLTLDAPTSGVDLAPTILRFAAAGREVDMTGMRGRDLLAGIVTEELPDQDNDMRFFEHAGSTQLGVRSGKWQLIETRIDAMELGFANDGKGGLIPVPQPRGSQLFDLEADPKMLVDVAAMNGEVVSELRDALAQWYAGGWDLAAGANTARETTAEERDALGKIGYGE